MSNDLTKLVDLLYGVVIGIGFADIARSSAFEKVWAGKAYWKDICDSLALFTAAIVFLLSDYIAYMWLSSRTPHAAKLYTGVSGASMFFIDVFLVSIHYLLINIATRKASVRHISYFLLLLIVWHVVVMGWYVLDGLRDAAWSSALIPTAHIFRGLVYVALLSAFHILKKRNVFGLSRDYSDGMETRAYRVFQRAYLLAVALIVLILSTIRFLHFHAQLFPGKA